MPFYAHSTERTDRADWETYPAHAAAVAELAGLLAAKFGAAKAGILAGQLHDLGKMCREFQEYIAGNRRQGPDHSTAGAREVLALAADVIDRLVAQLLAHAIAGHHAGLPDTKGTDGALKTRVQKTDLPPLDPSWRELFAYDAVDLMPKGFKPAPDRAHLGFQVAFLGRMLLSCLVDSDFLCTEAFYSTVNGTPVDRSWPALPEISASLVTAFDGYLANKLNGLGEAEKNAPLNRLRAQILSHVRAQGTQSRGIFTLDVPTGGGKTLASLAFALEHAKAHGMERIVYAIPFTSITEQTAAIFRDVLGDEMVLEHHSTVDGKARPEAGRDPQHAQAASKRRLAMENWAAPVVVTTNVQLFESLFAHRPSRCRKLHNLTNAVIVLDECQTIPLHVLRPCVAALNELALNYGCTVVLCTATQPALLAPKFEGGFENARELAPDPAQLHEKLRRVTFRQRGKLADETIVDELGDIAQGLVIVNSRVHARKLYLAARDRIEPDGLFHLSTRQTAADRRKLLADIRQRLLAEKPCRVIATSLIEAGVDVSFPRAWRARAGLDQMIQAAGRVNREAKWQASESFVNIFEPEEAKPPREIAAFIEATGHVLREQPDLLARDAIERYFAEVYWQKGDALDSTPMQHFGGRAAKQVLKEFTMSGGVADLPYRTVGEAFRLIQEGMEPVIVAVDAEPRSTLAALANGMSAGAAARALQPYLVQVPPRYRRALLDNGHAEFMSGFEDQFAILKTERFYSQEQGLVWEDADELGIEGGFI